jgi:hypothetical protein
MILLCFSKLENIVGQCPRATRGETARESSYVFKTFYEEKN